MFHVIQPPNTTMSPYPFPYLNLLLLLSGGASWRSGTASPTSSVSWWRDWASLSLRSSRRSWPGWPAASIWWRLWVPPATTPASPRILPSFQFLQGSRVYGYMRKDNFYNIRTSRILFLSINPLLKYTLNILKIGRGGNNQNKLRHTDRPTNQPKDG